MKSPPTLGLLVALAVSACAANEQNLLSRDARARALAEETDDWLEVAGLETRTVLKLAGPIRIRSANLRYATIEVIQRKYLIEVERECPALMDSGVYGGTHDYRMKRNMIRAGYDTIRGCRIETIYLLPDTTAETSAEDNSPSEETDNGEQ